MSLSTMPATSAALELQAAVAARLAAEADLLAALGGARVFDGAPRGTDFPYVTLGPASQSDWSDGSTAGAAVTLTLHVWSRGAGKREAWTILGILMRVLHEASLPLSLRSLVDLTAVFAEVRRDADGITEHGVLRLEGLVEG